MAQDSCHVLTFQETLLHFLAVDDLESLVQLLVTDAEQFDSQLVGNKIIITETGDYGKSGKYGYFTLVAKVGIVKDGDYVIVVKRNDHTREEFNMHYDSSKAK